MIRTLLTTTAIAALLGTAVIAQDATTTETPVETEETAPATDGTAPPAGDTTTPADDAATDDATDDAATDDATTGTDLDTEVDTDTDAEVLPDGDLTDGEDLDTGALEETEIDEPWDISQGYVAADSDNLGTELIGMPVYSSAGEDAENIGNINDIVFSESGQIEAVVIGVGGFLGIGEKQVAADFSALEFTIAADNTERWVLPTTSEALEGAPDFIWEEDEPIDPMMTDPGMPPADGMAPAPADGMAPAAPAAPM